MRPFIAVPIALTLALACTSSHDTRATDAGSGGPDAALDASASDAGDPRNCEEPSDCIVVGLGCCGVCGKPELEDVIAIRRDALPARQERCRTATCPACATMTNPSLIATCRSGQCAVVDVEQEDAISACHDDGDCRIRGTSCCECGTDTNPWSLIAIATQGERALTDLVCNQNPIPPCPECAPIYPSNVTASCNQTTGHCTATVH